jgi:hypothetical protein
MKTIILVISSLVSLSSFASEYDFECPKSGSDHVLKVSLKQRAIDEVYGDEGRDSVDSFKATRLETVDGNVYFYGRGGLAYTLYGVNSEQPYLVDAAEEVMYQSRAEKAFCHAQVR